MIPISRPRGRAGLAAALAGAALVALALTGCSAIRAIHKVEATVHGNQQVIDSGHGLVGESHDDVTFAQACDSRRIALASFNADDDHPGFAG